MKRKTKLFFTTCTMLILCLLMTTFVYAANFATAIGSAVNNINTTNHINDAADAYDTCGYSGTNRLIDPSYILLLSNLAAEVQFFASHGNVDNITFNQSGIRVGTDATYGALEYIGTNNVSLWENNTQLVTYAGCYTAGDGALDTNSITYVTAVEGADVTLGFKDEIYPSSLENWAHRYNDKLADGYGVLDAADYASGFIYVYDSVKDYHVIHHGDANAKIGNHRNTRSIASNIDDLSRTEILSNSEKILTATDANIISLLKTRDKSFNENNYEISRRTAGSTDLTNNKTVTTEYVDVVLKVGDFTTNAGYTIKVIDGKITKLYDNNIDLDIQKEALKNEKEYNVANTASTTKLNEYKNNAINQIKEKNTNKSVVIDEDSTNIKYFFDIETGKKFVLVSVRTENHKDGSVGYAYETVKYEI